MDQVSTDSLNIIKSSNCNPIWTPAVVDQTCANQSCGSKGKKKCGRCLAVWYCGSDCQKTDWRLHKKKCKGPQGPPKLTPTTSTQTKAEIQQEMIKKMEILKSLKPEDSETVCKDCGSPTLCFDSSVTRSYNKLGQPAGYTASATMMCKNMHMAGVSDATVGDDAPCTCAGVISASWVNYQVDQSYTYPSKPRVLLVAGFLFDMDEKGPYYEAIRVRFDQQNIAYDTINVDYEGAMTQRLTQGLYSKIIFMHFDPTGWRKRDGIFEAPSRFLPHLKQWVEQGGKFVFAGAEGEPASSILTYINSNEHWHFCGDFYRRVKHHYNRDKDAYLQEASFPKSHSCKATMLSGVSRRYQVYSPKEGGTTISNVPNFGGQPVSPSKTAIAAMPVGNKGGQLVYIGDVNAEPVSIDVLTAI